MQLSIEEQEELKAATTFWKGYVSDMQRNVILTDAHKDKLKTLIVVAEMAISEAKSGQGAQTVHETLQLSVQPVQASEASPDHSKDSQ